MFSNFVVVVCTQCYPNDLHCPAIMKQYQVMAPCITPFALSFPNLYCSANKGLSTRVLSPWSTMRGGTASRLYFVKVSLSLVRVLQAGEKGQTYRKWSSKKSCPTMSPSRCQIFIVVPLNINIKYRSMIYYFVICGLFRIKEIIFFTFTFVINEVSFLFLITLRFLYVFFF